MAKIRVCLFMIVFALWAALPPPECRAQQKEGVTFNFVDVDLAAVAKFISEVTGKNFIFDERLRGRITIIAPSKLRPEDAFSLFTSVLKLKGFTLVSSGVNAYKIVPLSEARESGMEVRTRSLPMNENFVARLISFKHISSEEAVAFLKPMVSRTGHISSFGPGNLILVVDSGLNIDKILGLVRAIDRPSLGEEPDVVFLGHSSAEAIAALLNQGIQKRAGKGRQQQGKAVADRRLNAVVLFGDKGVKDSMRRLVSLLDVEAMGTQSTINVYFLENADAEDLAKVIQGIVKSQPGKAKSGGTASPFESVSGIVITPDKATNSLVVVASPGDYLSIVHVIKQLDRKRKQVFVEAMIMEASVDKLRELGSRWRATATHEGEPVVIGGVGTVGASTVQTILTGLAGFTVGGLGNYFSVPVLTPDGTTTDLSVPGLAALFSLSEFKGVVNILSSPQILTSDNMEAEILVGENVPFVSKIEYGLTPGADTPFTSIERKDVGITLRITPQISEGDYVKLDIYQEISSVRESLAGDVSAVGPTTTKRSTKTSVIVHDGQTVVIGGLMQEREEETVTRVPLLHRIPLLGWLFKFKSVSKIKTNLLIFITPRVIRDAVDMLEITEERGREYARRERQHVEGQLMVRFHEDVPEELAIAILTEKDAVIIKRFRERNLYLVRLRAGLGVKDAIKEFEELREVEYAEPNYWMSTMGRGGGGSGR